MWKLMAAVITPSRPSPSPLPPTRISAPRKAEKPCARWGGESDAPPQQRKLKNKKREERVSKRGRVDEESATARRTVKLNTSWWSRSFRRRASRQQQISVSSSRSTYELSYYIFSCHYILRTNFHYILRYNVSPFFFYYILRINFFTFFTAITFFEFHFFYFSFLIT